jgi:hypothetical protein
MIGEVMSHENNRDDFQNFKPLHRVTILMLARILGGEIVDGGVLAPGPDLPPDDRSLTIGRPQGAPQGFTIVSRTVSRERARSHVIESVQAYRSPADLFGTNR